VRRITERPFWRGKIDVGCVNASYGLYRGTTWPTTVSKNCLAPTLPVFPPFGISTAILPFYGLQLRFNSPLTQVASEHCTVPVEGMQEFEPKLTGIVKSNETNCYWTEPGPEKTHAHQF
jgi:hypothetical protein